MMVKYSKTGGFLVFCLLINQISLSNANKIQLRKGETGRYTYYVSSQDRHLYCLYCPNIPMLFESEDVNRKFLVEECVNKNSPLKEKLDPEENKYHRYPVCNTGEIPSCALPQNLVGGSWKCKGSANLTNVPVYKTCILKCDSGYKKVGEGNIYCNESRKFDPPWTETNCTKEHESSKSLQAHPNSTRFPLLPTWESSKSLQAHSNSTRFPLLPTWVTVTVAALICILMTTVYYCKKYPQQCENAFSKIMRGLRKASGPAVLSNMPDSIIMLEDRENPPSVPIYTEMSNTRVALDSSEVPLLTPEQNIEEIRKGPTENEEKHTDTDGSDHSVCFITDIETKVHETSSDCERYLDTSKYVTGQHEETRTRPEGSSDFITGRYQQPTTHSDEKRYSHETSSKEFARDPTYCGREVNTDLFLELKKLGTNKVCEEILKLVEEMVGLDSGHRSNRNEPSDHVFSLVKEKNLRIGHIVNYLSESQRQDHDNILQQIETVHPDCIFCNSLYGGNAIQ